MSLTAIVEALVSTGSTPEQILAVVRAHESMRDKKELEKRERDRERQRRHRMSRDVTVTNSDKRDAPPLSGANGFSDSSFPPNSPPKENPSYEGQKKNPQNFAEWYALYPHKIGRAAAERSYLTASSKATQEELLEGLRRYIRTKPPDREYCNPATWLNQERWKDDPAPPPAQKASGFSITSFDQNQALEEVFGNAKPR